MPTKEDIALEEEFAKKRMDKGTFLRLTGYVRPYRRTFVLNLLFTLLATVSQLLGPKFIQFGIDRYLTSAVTPRLERKDAVVPLTPTLSPRERGNDRPSPGETGASEVSKTGRAAPPLPGGEDRGERERTVPMSKSSSASFALRGILIVSLIYLANLLLG